MSFDQAIDIPAALSTSSVTIALTDAAQRYSIRVKPADLTAFKKASGLGLPAKINASTQKSGVTCIKLGPDEWIVIADPSNATKLDAALTKAAGKFVCSVTEISHRNVGFTVSGNDAAKLLNVGCPLDLSVGKFPVGKGTRTLFESASIVLLRTGEDRFHVECWRSFGPYLRDFFLRVVTTN